MTSDDVRQALDRVAASETFRESENLRRLLLYLGEASLDGRADQLKEYTVGVDGLGRPATFEPRLDSSVRMLAGRLRRKLEDHYRSEGSAEVVRIAFPKGGYKLAFEEAAIPPVALSSDAERQMVRWKLTAAIFAVAFVAVALYAFLPRIRSGSTPATAELSPEVEALWQPILDGRGPVLVSFGSPLFVTADGWMLRRHDLNDWSQVDSDPPLQRAKRLMGFDRLAPNYNYAGIGDVNGAFLVGKLLGGRVPQLTLKRGAVLSWEDIQSNHFIFIGNGKNQEKLRYLLDRLEFNLDGVGVHCHAPRGGEPADYLNSRRVGSANASVEYGLISLLPGSRKGRYMMILSANDTAAIWGVVETVTNPRFAEPLVNRLRSRGALPKAFQAVIRIRLNAEVPIAMDYVVYHEIPPDRLPLL
jgi:hypothetical protein